MNIFERKNQVGRFLQNICSFQNEEPRIAGEAVEQDGGGISAVVSLLHEVGSKRERTNKKVVLKEAKKSQRAWFVE